MMMAIKGLEEMHEPRERNVGILKVSRRAVLHTYLRTTAAGTILQGLPSEVSSKGRIVL